MQNYFFFKYGIFALGQNKWLKDRLKDHIGHMTITAGY